MKLFGLLILTLGMSCVAFAHENEDTAKTDQPQQTEQTQQEVAQADNSCCDKNDSESNE